MIKTVIGWGGGWVGVVEAVLLILKYGGKETIYIFLIGKLHMMGLELTISPHLSHLEGRRCQLS